MTSPRRRVVPELDQSPVPPGPGVRWEGDGELASQRAPKWGADGTAPLDASTADRVAAPRGASRSQPAVSGMVLVTAVRRLIAWILDRGLKSLIFVVVLSVAGIEVSPTPWEQPQLIAASALLNAGYDFVFGIRGVTPAAFLLKIQIVDVEGRDPGVRKSLARAAASAINETLLYAGSLWIIFDARRQALQDKAAGTLVISTPEPDEQPEGDRRR